MRHSEFARGAKTTCVGSSSGKRLRLHPHALGNQLCVFASASWTAARQIMSAGTLGIAHSVVEFVLGASRVQSPGVDTNNYWCPPVLPHSSVSGQNNPETVLLRWADARPMRPSLFNVELVWLIVILVSTVHLGKGARAVERSKYSGISFDGFCAILLWDCRRRNIEKGRCQGTPPSCSCGF